MKNDCMTGFMAGLLASIVIAISAFAVRSYRNSICRDKLTIEYVCNDKEYDRKIFYDMLESSGVQTNFINKEFTMDKHSVKCILSNPKNANNKKK